MSDLIETISSRSDLISESFLQHIDLIFYRARYLDRIAFPLEC